jgi:hypothetical protein
MDARIARREARGALAARYSRLLRVPVDALAARRRHRR